MPVLQGHSIVAALRAAFCQDVARQQLLQQAADRIQAAGPPYTSAYLYMVHDSELRLEAYAGRPTEHTTIPVGKGICGSAVAEGANQNVGDVTARDEYLACNLDTRSELVVLIRRGDLILGQIDIDSDQLDPFTPEEEAAVQQVADALAVLL
ncbi:MAG: GAF domain-containing protein [Gemmatimonadales bacterium]|jgi:GAF domain-containing protein